MLCILMVHPLTEQVYILQLNYILYAQLVYQQEEVHTIPTSLEELSVAGKLRIIERVNWTLDMLATLHYQLYLASCFF